MSMSITAKVICDSMAPCGVRLTTMELRYPRFIHSEFMTHRAFSRNARSSRAVPVARMLAEVRDEPVIPISWGSNRKGMQAGEEFDGEHAAECERRWLNARDNAASAAEGLLKLGIHKQHVNRLLEPFSHIDVLVTATDWDNFFALRMHPDAQPEMVNLAYAMYRAMGESEPAPVGPGGWHLPYILQADWREAEAESVWEAGQAMAKVSAARCRRISYAPWDGSDASIEADLARFDEMVRARPIHASPLEHQAMATGDAGVRSGNFRGWVQFRQSIAGHDATRGAGM